MCIVQHVSTNNSNRKSYRVCRICPVQCPTAPWSLVSTLIPSRRCPPLQPRLGWDKPQICGWLFGKFVPLWMDLRVLVRTRRHGDTGPRYREILKLNPGPGISVTSGIPAASAATLGTSAANRLIGEVVQSRRRPLLGPSPGWKQLLPLSHLRHY